MLLTAPAQIKFPFLSHRLERSNTFSFHCATVVASTAVMLPCVLWLFIKFAGSDMQIFADFFALC